MKTDIHLHVHAHIQTSGGPSLISSAFPSYSAVVESLAAAVDDEREGISSCSRLVTTGPHQVSRFTEDFGWLHDASNFVDIAVARAYVCCDE